MVVGRTSSSSQVWDLSSKLQLPQTTVKLVVNSYMAYCKELLIAGGRLDFYGFVSVVPYGGKPVYSTTFAYNCLEVADRIQVPYYTVYKIMESYVNNCIECLHNGIVVEIRGLVVCKPMLEDGVLCKVRSRASQCIKDWLPDGISVRVYTSKILKKRMVNL